MFKYIRRVRGTVALAAVAAGLLPLGACNVKHELLAPQQPGVISPTSVANATAAEALYAGALDSWKQAMVNGDNNTEALFQFDALFTDEVRSADTFSQRNDADQRVTQSNDGVLTPIYNSAQQARGRARDAINSLLAFDTSPLGTAHTGEMYLAMGAIETALSESFCNGVPYGETVNGQPVYGQPLSAVDGAKLSITRFDSALVYLKGSDATSTAIKNAVLIAKGRAQVDVGDFAGAAATVAPVPTSFQYVWNYSITTIDDGWWVMGPAVKRYNAGDSISAAGIIQNAIPFAELKDPRVVTEDTHVQAEDRKSDFIQVNNWDRDDPVPPFSGIDARLIQAEAQLNAGNIGGMMTTLNALRTSPQTIGIFAIPAMAALPTPADKTAATNLFFREKALWQYERGWRMGDLRRLVRQYGRTQDQVYPNGKFARNTTPSGSYGTEVAFPVPDAETTNPNFHGCIDTNA